MAPSRGRGAAESADCWRHGFDAGGAAGGRAAAQKVRARRRGRRTRAGGARAHMADPRCWPSRRGRAFVAPPDRGRGVFRKD